MGIDSLTFEIASELIRLEPKTGLLFWLKRSEEMFSSSKAHVTWNARFSDKEALTWSDRNGYRSGHILSVRCMAHRVVWLLSHGEWPHGFVDHIDGDPGNNKVENLRDVTRQENALNKRIPINNKSGCIGVYWNTRKQVWVANISSGSKRREIGYFTEFSAAVAARKAAEVSAGYHANHGRAG